MIALWATPRATSTAFEWVMSNRGDMSCFHEPYNEAFYHGEDHRHERYFDMDKTLQPTTGLTFSSIHNKLLRTAEKQPVFIKDFAYSVMHLVDGDFINAFQHAFLIRNPEKVLTSMHAHWPDITLPEIGFEELFRLFEAVREHLGRTPLVIDSDDFVSNPEICMEAYCRAMDIPFLPDALSWENQKEQNAQREVTWSHAATGFHNNLKASTGIQEQKRDYPPLESNDRLRQLHDACIPHYEALYAHRLPI